VLAAALGTGRLPLNAEARKALEAIQPVPVADVGGAVFRGKRGPYTVRHDTARRLVETIDLPIVAAWLGHERLDTVRIYSQPDEAEAALERAAVALESR